jgi:acyl-CoA hydrolase
VGDLVHLHASVNYVGTSSIVVGVRVEAENIHTGEIRHTNSSYFTMVAMDEKRQPRTVPGLILESDIEIQRYSKTLKRRELLKLYKEAIKTQLDQTDSTDLEATLKNQRCLIQLP